MTHRASSNNFRIRLAPTPTYISSNWDPAAYRNGTPAVIYSLRGQINFGISDLPSPAIALAISVFPVPGGPFNKIPFGVFAPISRNRSGFWSSSTTSWNSDKISSIPFTSEKLFSELSTRYSYKSFENKFSMNSLR